MAEQDARVATEPKSAKDIAAARPEIQFALVLARTIDSISSDPELLRSAVYELARQRLQELTQDPLDKKRLMDALEIAIAGVEAHTKDTKLDKIVMPSIAGYLQELNDRDATPTVIESATADTNEIIGMADTASTPGSETVALSSQLKASDWPSPADLKAVSVHEALPRIIEGEVSRADVSFGTNLQMYAPSSYAMTSSNEYRALRRSSSMALRYIALLAFVGVIAAMILAQQHGFFLSQIRNAEVTNWFGSGRGSSQPLAEVVQGVPPAMRSPAPIVTPLARTEGGLQRPLPTTYGVFAESGGKLYELQALRGRAPDIRVAISAAITKPSETILPDDGHLRFLVYRRDTRGSDGSDAIDIRFIAKVRQDTTFDPSGKEVKAASENVWAIRNISLPLRAAPIKEDPEMYEIGPRDADAALSPGRYALVLKGVAYDFTVEGMVTDKRHCLERLLAANGVFYSECPNLGEAVPAATAASMLRR